MTTLSNDDVVSAPPTTTAAATTKAEDHHPINPPAIPYNFAPLTSSSSSSSSSTSNIIDNTNNDSFNYIYGCQRPGASNELSSYGAIKQSDVDEWVDYVKENGTIKRSLCLLNETEIGFYEQPGYKKMLEKRNIYATMCNLSIPNSKDIALNALRDAVENKECIAVHCSGGEGRTGVILGLWCSSVGVASSSTSTTTTIKDASDYVLKEAKKLNVVRKPNVHKITTLIEKGYLP